MPPTLLLPLHGAGPQLASPPHDRLPRQAADHEGRSPAGHFGLAEPHSQAAALAVCTGLVAPVKFGIGIGAGRLGDGQGKIVAGGLLGRHDQ